MSKSCVFCNRTGKMSKEHIWPIWMHELLPPLGNGYHISELNTFQWKDQTGSKKSERQGHLTTKKLRIVCQNCNNGWMSQLEDEVKPILIKVLARETFELCSEKQETLARWIAMKSIIGEHSEQQTHMTPKMDRSLLRSQKKIPEYFSFYIGSHNTESNSGWFTGINFLFLIAFHIASRTISRTRAKGYEASRSPKILLYPTNMSTILLKDKVGIASYKSYPALGIIVNSWFIFKIPSLD